MNAHKDWSLVAKPKLEGITACILAGGLGTRLRSVLPDLPKAMAPIDGAPFLHHLLEKLARSGIRRTVLCTGHLAEKIQSEIGNRFQGMEMLYSQEDRVLGTGGAARLAMNQVASARVLVLNGDSYCDVDLLALVESHAAKQARGTMVMANVQDVSRFGSVRVAVDGMVTSFVEKGSQSGPGWINAGVYLLEREILVGIASGLEVSLEREVFPRLINHGLFGYKMEAGGFIDIGTPASYSEAREFFAQRSHG